MKEIAPGVWHWTAMHTNIGSDVDSYYLAHEGAVIDPMEPEGGVERIGKIAPPAEVLLTSRHHYRAGAAFRKAYGIPVRCHRAGLHEFMQGEEVEPFEFGDRLAGGIEAIEVGALTPEETAFYANREGGILSIGDAVIRWGPGGPLGFVPDKYIGDDPDAVKRAIRKSLARLLDREFEILLLAHGDPIVGGARDALRAFVLAGDAT